jgi:ribosomal protein S27AE
MGKKKGGKEKKGKKKPTKTARVKVSKFYKVEGKSLEKLGKDCPKCGVGFKMASHKTKDNKIRYTCGKCGMNIWE